MSESWGSTDAGGSSARARTLCHSHTLPPSQIHHHCHRGFPVKVLQPRKPQKWMGFFCQICRYIVLTAAKEMSVGAITLILQGLFLLVLIGLQDRSAPSGPRRPKNATIIYISDRAYHYPRPLTPLFAFEADFLVYLHVLSNWQRVRLSNFHVYEIINDSQCPDSFHRCFFLFFVIQP